MIRMEGYALGGRGGGGGLLERKKKSYMYVDHLLLF